MNLQTTTLEQLKAIKKTEVVSLGAFDDGTELIAEVQRPYLLDLITSGKIPNSLLTAAMTMFKDGAGTVVKQSVDSVEALQQMVGLMKALAESCLVNPSYANISDCGLRLSQDQLMNILAYVQGGASHLENFRNQQSSNEGNKSESNVQPSSEPSA